MRNINYRKLILKMIRTQYYGHSGAKTNYNW